MNNLEFLETNGENIPRLQIVKSHPVCKMTRVAYLKKKTSKSSLVITNGKTLNSYGSVDIKKKENQESDINKITLKVSENYQYRKSPRTCYR